MHCNIKYWLYARPQYVVLYSYMRIMVYGLLFFCWVLRSQWSTEVDGWFGNELECLIAVSLCVVRLYCSLRIFYLLFQWNIFIVPYSVLVWSYQWDTIYIWCFLFVLPEQPTHAPNPYMFIIFSSAHHCWTLVGS